MNKGKTDDANKQKEQKTPSINERQQKGVVDTGKPQDAKQLRKQGERGSVGQKSVKRQKNGVAQSVPEVNLVALKKKNFIKIFTIAYVAFDIAFMLFFFITLTLLITHTIVWSKVYTIITFAVIIANLPFLIYMLVGMIKTTNRYN